MRASVWTIVHAHGPLVRGLSHQLSFRPRRKQCREFSLRKGFSYAFLTAFQVWLCVRAESQLFDLRSNTREVQTSKPEPEHRTSFASIRGASGSALSFSHGCARLRRVVNAGELAYLLASDSETLFSTDRSLGRTLLISLAYFRSELILGLVKPIAYFGIVL